MTTKELYLKTIFCCMACDGDIATEEVTLVKNISSENKMVEDIDVEQLLNQWIADINKNGALFLKKYLKELAEQELSPEEQLMIVDYALQTIEADNRIEYSEVKFFKKIRSRLSISDEDILKAHPDKEDFLLPDINVEEDPMWTDIHLSTISLEQMPLSSNQAFISSGRGK